MLFLTLNNQIMITLHKDNHADQLVCQYPKVLPYYLDSVNPNSNNPMILCFSLDVKND